ncbi:hypothetical protein CPC08DRAFT_715310, partial [Agrocybe pediades]
MSSDIISVESQLHNRSTSTQVENDRTNQKCAGEDAADRARMEKRGNDRVNNPAPVVN